MPESKGERLRREADEALNEALRHAEERGDLRHLYGKPLDLSDDSPDWLVNRMLKQAGYSHPTLERGKEVDAVAAEVQELLNALQQRRDRLVLLEPGYTPEQAGAFNQARDRALEEYREALGKLNRTIRDYNLGVPEVLHRRPVLVDRAVRSAAEAIPLLDPNPPRPSSPPTRLRRLWQRFLGRRRRTRGGVTPTP